jgi:hypothetical protein
MATSPSFFWGGTVSVVSASGWVELYATADTVESATVDTVATGMSFTPDPSSYYEVEVLAWFLPTSGQPSVGAFARIDPGNGSGVHYGHGRTADITPTFFIGAAGSDNVLANGIGTGAPSCHQALILTTSSPTAISFKFRTEADTYPVTCKTHSVMRYRKVG